MLVFQSDEKTASRRGDGLWPCSFHHFPLTSIGPQFACGLNDMIDDEHFYRGLPLVRLQSELFPYSNEDSGFFRGVVIVTPGEVKPGIGQTG